MIYEYFCILCDRHFDIVKSVANIENVESCECGAVGERIKFPRRTYLNNTAVENAEYNHGLGCVVQNKKHRADVAKQKGLVEIGNDYSTGESHQKEAAKVKKANNDESWNKVSRELGID